MSSNITGSSPASGEAASVSGKKESFTKSPLFRWGFTLLFVAIIAWKVDVGLVIESLASARPELVAAAFLVAITEQVAIGLLWRAMLSARGYQVPMRPMLQITLISNFFGFAIPAAAGPDISRVVGLSRYLKSVSEALSSLLLVRLFSLQVLFLIAFFSFYIFRDRLPDEAALDMIGYMVAAGFVVMTFVIIGAGPAFGAISAIFDRLGATGWREKLARFHQAYSHYVTLPVAMGSAALAATGTQLSRVVIAWFLSLSMGLDIDFVPFLVFVPIISAVTKIPLTVGGLGLREGGYALMFGYIGVAAGQAVALSLLVFANIVFVAITGGLLYWLFGAPEGKTLDDFKVGSVRLDSDQPGPS